MSCFEYKRKTQETTSMLGSALISLGGRENKSNLQGTTGNACQSPPVLSVLLLYYRFG